MSEHNWTCACQRCQEEVEEKDFFFPNWEDETEYRLALASTRSYTRIARDAMRNQQVREMERRIALQNNRELDDISRVLFPHNEELDR